MNSKSNNTIELRVIQNTYVAHANQNIEMVDIIDSSDDDFDTKEEQDEAREIYICDGKLELGKYFSS